VQAAVYDLIGRSRIKGNRHAFSLYGPGLAGELDLFAASLYLDIGGRQITTFSGTEEDLAGQKVKEQKRTAAGDPIYRKWWFWTGMTVLTAGVIVSGVLIFSGIGSSKAEPDGNDGRRPSGLAPFRF
jgi:hypothetical protein